MENDKKSNGIKEGKCMKVYLVYENDTWEGTHELDGIYGTEEQAVKRTTEIILENWNEFMSDVVRDYNAEHNTHLTHEQFASLAAEHGGHYESCVWEEMEVL